MANITNAGELTPVELHDGVWLKREDLYTVAGHHGAKARTCYMLASAAVLEGMPGLVTAGSRHSPQVAMVAAIGLQLGMPVRVHVPAGPETPELAQAAAAGAEVIRHRPGHNSVIVARAREDAQERGWREVPFGMEHPLAVELAAAQVRNLPGRVRRVVVPVGSGMSLAGILHGIQNSGRPRPDVVGVVVGADPTRRLDRWAPHFWRAMVQLRPALWQYHEHRDGVRLGSVELDPVYEAKCMPELREPGSLLWVVGRRAGA